MQTNRFELSGYLAAKPDSRRLPSGTAVANVRIGQTHQYQTKEGSKKHTNWFNLSFYGELSTIAATYEKGDNIHVIGSLQQRQFTPKDGSTRTVYEVIVQRCHRVARHTNPQPVTQTESPIEENTPDLTADEVDAWAAI
jgi:single-strand DNA-binding protein